MYFFQLYLSAERLKTQGSLNRSIQEPKGGKLLTDFKNIAKQVNYAAMETKQIWAQHKYLEQILKNINEELNSKLSHKKVKFLKRLPHKSSKVDLKLIETDIIHGERQLNQLEFNFRKLEIRKRQIQHPEAVYSLEKEVEDLKNRVRDSTIQIRQINRDIILREKAIKENKKQQKGKMQRGLELQIFLLNSKKEEIEQKIIQAQIESNQLVDQISKIEEQYSALEISVKQIKKMDQIQSQNYHIYMEYRSKVRRKMQITKRIETSLKNLTVECYKKMKQLESKVNSNRNIDLELEKLKQRILQSRQLILQLAQKCNRNQKHSFLLTEVTNQQYHSIRNKNDRAQTQTQEEGTAFKKYSNKTMTMEETDNLGPYSDSFEEYDDAQS